MVTAGTAPDQAVALPSAPGLLGKLMAAVRPEFRVDIFVPERGALVFDAPRRAGCRGASASRAPGGFARATTTSGRTRAAPISTRSPRRRPRRGSAARSSRSASSRDAVTAVPAGACASATTGSGNEPGSRTARHGWPGSPPCTIPVTPVCALSYCTLWTQGRSPFCVDHRSRWEAAGRPAPRASSSCSASPTATTASTSGRWATAGSSSWRLQYALQCRHDERQVKTPAAVARPVIALAAASAVVLAAGLAAGTVGASSSTPATPPGTARTGSWRSCATPTAAWRTCTAAPAGRQNSRGTCGSCGGSGSRARKRLRFDGIPQPWLRHLAKRFARWRLSIGRSPIQTYIDVQAVTRLAGFLDSPPVSVTSLAGVDRAVLERYLADLATDPRALALPQPGHQLAERVPRRDPPARMGPRACPRARRSTPTTSPSPRSACPAGWPSTSWPRSSSPPTSTGGTTPTAGCSPSS